MSHVICPTCGSPSATARAPERYLYEDSGIPNLWLKGGVTLTTCKACGEDHVRIEKEAQLLQVITLGLLMDARPLTGFEMKFLRGSCRMSQASLAEELGISRRETIAERESKENPGVPFAEEMYLRQLMLEHFNQQLRQEENNFLAPHHREELKDLHQFFMAFSKKLARKPAKRPKPKRVAAAMSSQTELWEFDRAA